MGQMCGTRDFIILAIKVKLRTWWHCVARGALSSDSEVHGKSGGVQSESLNGPMSSVDFTSAGRDRNLDHTLTHLETIYPVIIYLGASVMQVYVSLTATLGYKSC